MRHWFLSLVFAAALLIHMPEQTWAQVRVPSFFSENMVLQRDVQIPVWGWAKEGEPITVLFGDQKVTTTAAANGRWQVTLQPTPAGGPYTLAIMGRDVNQYLMFTQVLVGEVWIVCGQSNAIMPLHDCDDADEAIANRMNHPNIRAVSVGQRDSTIAKTPQEQAYSFWGPCKWENASYLLTRWSRGDKPQSQTIPGTMSGLAYFFAREVSRHFNDQVPVGVIQLGAILPVQTWIDDETVAADPLLAPVRGKIYPNATSCGYNDQVAPLAPFPVKGVVYYQGEMNAVKNSAKDVSAFYQAGLAGMIRSWRKAWNNPQMPFLIVQLAGFIKHAGEKDGRLDMDAATLARFAGENIDHGFCHVRQGQLQAWRSVPNTGMAVTFDLGDPYDIHPKRKLPIAQRLFLHARKLAYGETTVSADSPFPEQVEFKDKECHVRFGGIGGGLVTHGDALKGFELSSNGKDFLPATAEIRGNTVVITHPQISRAVAVRYAWAGWPDATLYNRQGLPATPFRHVQPTPSPEQ